MESKYAMYETRRVIKGFRRDTEGKTNQKLI